MLKRNARVGRGTTRPRYALSRLLVCSACGRPMRASTSYGLHYYGCRRDLADDARCSGSRRTLREDRLMPWAEGLFERLDSLRPADFADKVDAARSHRRQSPEALTQLDGTLERLRKLYLWQHIAEEDYKRERARLEELRADLTAATGPPVATVQLDGIADAWKVGDPTIRHELLAALFQSLIVRDGCGRGIRTASGPRGGGDSLMDAVSRLDLAKRGKGGV